MFFKKKKISIDTIKARTFFDILQTKDTSLLGCKNHKAVWERLHKEYLEHYISTKQQKIFKLRFIDIPYLILKQSLILANTDIKYIGKKSETRGFREFEKIGYKKKANESFKDFIDRMRRVSNNMSVDISEKKQYLLSLEGKKDDEEKDSIKGNYFDAVVASLMIAGINCDPDSIKASTFFQLKNQYERKIELEQKAFSKK